MSDMVERYLRSDRGTYFCLRATPWAVSTEYEEGDALSHKNKFFIAKQYHISDSSNEPGVGASYTDDWILVSVQGYGSVNWQGTWNGVTTYYPLDAVINDSDIYICVVEHSNQEPPDTDYWIPIAVMAGSGNAFAPTTHADAYVPQWDGVNTWTLKEGVPIGTTANCLVQLDANGKLPIVAYWAVFPGTPTRVSDTSFSVTDTGNANNYEDRFSPSTVICWTKSGGGIQVARIITATYAANAVTYTIKGNTLSAGFSNMMYCLHRARRYTFSVPGSMPGSTATTDCNGQHFIPDCDLLGFDAQAVYGTAATTTDGTWDINDDGSSIFTTKLVATAGSTTGVDTQCNSTSGTSLTAIVKGSIITLDYDSGHATTPGRDATIDFWYIPYSWILQ